MFLAFLIHSLLCGCVTLAYLMIRKIVKVSPTVRYIFDCILFLFYVFPTMLIPKGVAGGEGIIVHDRADAMSVALMTDGTANETITQTAQAAEFTQSNVGILFQVWLGIFVVLLAYMCLKNLSYLTMLKRWKRPVEGSREMGLFTDRIYICPVLTTPILSGIVYPTLLFPEDMSEKKSIRLISYHEEVHCKRKDILMKMAVTMISAAHWFNPFVWILNYCFQEDCELSCDYEAAVKMTEEEKKDYLALLVQCARNQNSMSMVAAFGFGKKFLERRVEIVMSKRKKLVWGIVVLAVCALCGLGIITCYTYHKELTPEETITQFLADPEENSYLMIDTWIDPEYIESIEFVSLEKADIVHAQQSISSDIEEGYTKICVFAVTYEIIYKEEYEQRMTEDSGIKTKFFTLVYMKDGWRINAIGY